MAMAADRVDDRADDRADDRMADTADDGSSSGEDISPWDTEERKEEELNHHSSNHNNNTFYTRVLNISTAVTYSQMCSMILQLLKTFTYVKVISISTKSL